MEQAHLDNRKSGPEWILLDDKIVVSADPRRAEDVRWWFRELKTRSATAREVERYRIVEFDLERLLDTLGEVTPSNAGNGTFSTAPDIVISPFADRIYGLTVSKLDETIISGRRILVASGVLTNSYGVRGEWQFSVDLAAGIVDMRLESTESLLRSFHPPDSVLVVLGEIEHCRLTSL